jgi:hypothetical protein
MLLSDVARAQQRRLAAVVEKHRQAPAALQALTERYRAALAVKAELEGRIFHQPATVVVLYEAAKRLRALAREDRYPALLELVVTALEARA